MDSVSRYGFINAKLRARIGQIHSSDTLDRMIKAPTLVEAISVLKGTKHEELANIYDKTGDLQQVELALMEEEIKVHREIISHVDSTVASFVSVLLERVEEENIKNVLRLWFSSVLLHHEISYRVGYINKEKIVYDINYTKIVNALSWKDVVEAFLNTPYYDVLSSYSEEQIRSNGLFDTEIALDHLWYKRLFDAISTLSSTDKEVASKIYNVDVDLKNILYLIRYGYYHVLPSIRLAKIFIPYARVYSLLSAKISSGNITFDEAKVIVKRAYPAIGDLFSKLEEKGEIAAGNHTELAYDTLEIENYLAQRRKKEFTSILSGDPFTIGTLLSYIFLYKNECHMIRAILSAKYYNWSEDQIRRELN